VQSFNSPCPPVQTVRLKGDAVACRADSDERCHKAREVLPAMIGAKRGGKGSVTRIMQALVGKAHHAAVMWQGSPTTRGRTWPASR